MWERVLPTSLLPDALKESRGAILVKGHGHLLFVANAELFYHKQKLLIKSEASHKNN